MSEEWAKEYVKQHGMRQLLDAVFRAHRADQEANASEDGELYTIPDVYDASDCYDSSSLKRVFVKTYKKLHGRAPEESQVFSVRPAIVEHGIAPLSSLQDLELVCISDVLKKVNHVHTGCVMLVQVIHKPYRDVGTTILVKDSKNGIMMVTLFNYVSWNEHPKDLFPVGKKFALLCPYLKNARDEPQEHLLLRCDNPQFIVLYDDDRYIWKKASGPKKSPSPSKLKQMGNQHFRKGKLEEACKCYSKALAHPDIDKQTFASDKVICLTNRAEINLRHECWQEAATDAQDALEIQPDFARAKFRLAEALSRIGKASEALVLLEQLENSDADRSSRSAIQEVAKDCRRIANEERGKYDIHAMMKEASTKQPSEGLSTFHATFSSPKVAIGVPITMIRGDKSYRGCKALSDIKEGELIMSSKAFAMGMVTPEGIAMEGDDPNDEESRQGNAWMEMVSQVVRQLWKIPSLRKEFYSLSDGDPSRPPVGDVDMIDLAIIFDIVRSHSFGQYPYDEGIQKTWKNLNAASGCPGDPRNPESPAAAGLWINESMLNNSCTPNCRLSSIADQIFIRTTKPVKKGDELCVAYCPDTSIGYEDRAKVFSQWTQFGVGFECVCDHCHLLRSREDLRLLANEVHDGMLQVKTFANGDDEKITKELVGPFVFPPARRRAIFKTFSKLPLRLQHYRIADLYELEAWILASQGDVHGALKAKQLEVNINYAVEGSGNWNYFGATWCIAGLAVACKQHSLAHESLEKIWNSPAFQAHPKEEAELMFQNITQRYVTQLVPFDPQHMVQIQKLVYTVLNGNP